MEILFVIDSLENIEHKVTLLSDWCSDIKFFVNAKHVAGLVKNKFIVDRIVAIYKNNVNVTIDKYLKAAEYKPTKTLLYYSSADINRELLDKINQNIELNPNTIYIKKKFGFWDKIKLWFYKKFIKLIFGAQDELASTKIQYFSEHIMSNCTQSNFRNHIFSMDEALTIEIESENASTYYDKIKFNKNYLYNPIAVCLILICYVVLERFFNLPFWVYFLVIALILATIINLIVMIVKDSFDLRYKK